WHTLTPILELHDVPQQFTTTSRVALIGNDWKTLNADVAALEDRGHVLCFEPTALEVHRQAAHWFWDQEVFDFVALQLHLIVQHSLRTYGQASELKQAGLDWKRAVLSRCVSGAALWVARLQADPSFASEAARVQAFIAADGGCRATYYHYARKLRPKNEAPRIVLTHKTPPKAGTANPDPLGDLRRRARLVGNGETIRPRRWLAGRRSERSRCKSSQGYCLGAMVEDDYHSNGGMVQNGPVSGNSAHPQRPRLG